MMKNVNVRSTIILIMIGFTLVFFNIYPAKIFAEELKPIVTMGTPLVKMNKKTKVVIMGTGFKPGQEVKILLTTKDEMQTSLHGTIKPAGPVADKSGTWVTTWTLGNFARVVKAGAYKLNVTDSKYNFITHTPIGFDRPKKKKKKK
ncbi:hypothetical protein ACFL0M_06600 [Thermodesulfobacteriota bacterium]